MKEIAPVASPAPRVFIATLGKEAEVEGFKIADSIRAGGFWVEPNYGGASLKSQLRKADRLGAEFAFIIGENELKAGKIQWKNLKKGGQGEVEIKEVLMILTHDIQPSHP